MKTSARATSSLVVLLVSVAVVGCSGGSVGGEIDGKSVPRFFSAAYSEINAGNGGSVLFALALPGDSCADGAELFEATDAEERVDFINEHVPVDSWLIAASVFAVDDDDLKEATIEFGEADPEVFMSISLCRQDKKAEEDDPNADCFGPTSGDLDISWDGDEGALHLKSAEKIEFRDVDGDDAGKVDIDITFHFCEAIGDAFEDAQNTPPPPPEDDEDSCFSAFDGVCDEPGECEPGTDTSDCEG